MPLPHYLLAFAVALTWGLDYVAIGFAGVAVVAPWTMLVPVVSMVGGALFLGEPLTGWKVLAAALVMAGLGLNQVAGLGFGLARPEGTARPSGNP